MKNQFNIIAMLLISVLFSCNGQKTTNKHSHADESSHNHSDYFASYTLKDDTYGTNTIVTVDSRNRTMVTNALPNHKTGEFPNQGNPNTISEQNQTYTFPVNPKYTGKAQWVIQPGVALNGVKFQPGTAEVVICDTGENYRVEGIQDVIDLGLDFNLAHVQPTGAYHYHGTPTSVIEGFDSGEDLVHIGFAQDGFPMYYSKNGLYKPSYKLLDGNREGEDCTYENPHNSMNISVDGHHDGTYGSDFEYVEDFGDLDECNGIIIDGKYMYLVTNEFPYISRCLMGEVSQDERQGPPREKQDEGRRSGARPNVDQLLEQMDTNKDGKLSKKEVKGPISEQFGKIDTNDDGFLTKEELEKEQNGNGQRPQNKKN